MNTYVHIYMRIIMITACMQSSVITTFEQPAALLNTLRSFNIILIHHLTHSTRCIYD